MAGTSPGPKEALNQRPHQALSDGQGCGRPLGGPGVHTCLSGWPEASGCPGVPLRLSPRLGRPPHCQVPVPHLTSASPASTSGWRPCRARGWSGGGVGAGQDGHTQGIHLPSARLGRTLCYPVTLTWRRRWCLHTQSTATAPLASRVIQDAASRPQIQAVAGAALSARAPDRSPPYSALPDSSPPLPCRQR